jgi:hypothetical protein
MNWVYIPQKTAFFTFTLKSYKLNLIHNIREHRIKLFRVRLVPGPYKSQSRGRQGRGGGGYACHRFHYVLLEFLGNESGLLNIFVAGRG